MNTNWLIRLAAITLEGALVGGIGWPLSSLSTWGSIFVSKSRTSRVREAELEDPISICDQVGEGVAGREWCEGGHEQLWGRIGGQHRTFCPGEESGVGVAGFSGVDQGHRPRLTGQGKSWSYVWEETQERKQCREVRVMSGVSVAASEIPPKHPAHRKCSFDHWFIVWPALPVLQFPLL